MTQFSPSLFSSQSNNDLLIDSAGGRGLRIWQNMICARPLTVTVKVTVMVTVTVSGTLTVTLPVGVTIVGQIQRLF